MIAGECCYFFFLLTIFCCFVRAVSYRIKPHLLWQGEHLAYPSKIQFICLIAHRKQFLPLSRRQGSTRSIFHNADMIDFLQQRKVFERPGRFCCTRLCLPFKSAGADHFFNHITAIGAISAGPFVERPLSRQNREVFRFHLRRRPYRTVLALRRKKFSGLIHDLITLDR